MRQGDAAPYSDRQFRKGLKRIKRLQDEAAVARAAAEDAWQRRADAPCYITPAELLENEARGRAAQELRDMGEHEAALMCESGLQFPSH